MVKLHLYKTKSEFPQRGLGAFIKIMGMLGLLFCSFESVGPSAQAGEPDTFAERPHQVGIKSSFNSGNSIAYRYWPGRLGIEGALSPRVNNTYTEIHSGIAGLFTCLEGRVVDYYGTIGNDLFYTEGTSEFLSPYGRAEQGMTWDVKAGVGVEVEIVHRVMINGVIGMVNKRTVRDSFDGKLNAEFSLLYAF